MAPILRKEFLDIQATIECVFTLKSVRDMKRTFSQKQIIDKYSLYGSVIWSVWLNGWVFLYELSGYGFEYRYSHLKFRYHACFEQRVRWHSGNYRMQIHSLTCRRHDKNIQSTDLFITNSICSFQKATRSALSDFHKMTLTVLESTFKESNLKRFVYGDIKRSRNPLLRIYQKNDYIVWTTINFEKMYFMMFWINILNLKRSMLDWIMYHIWLRHHASH